MRRGSMVGPSGAQGGVRDSNFIKQCLARTCAKSRDYQGGGRPELVFPRPSFLALRKPVTTDTVDEMLNETAGAALDSIEESGLDFAMSQENFEEVSIELEGGDSALKDELLALRALYLKECRNKGNHKWADNFSRKDSLFELLRLLAFTLNAEFTYYDQLGENIKKILLLLKEGKINISEDKFYPGQIELSGDDNEALFWFLEAGDFFGKEIRTLSMAIGSSDKEIDRLVQIPALNKLRGLDWTHNTITKAGVFRLFNTQMGYSLRRLDLTRNWLNEGGLKALLSKSHLSRLTHLNLTMNSLDNDTISDLFRKPIATNLTDLVLKLNLLSEDTTKSLKSAKFPNLKSLDLSSCALMDQGISSLVANQNMQSIEELVLNKNLISDAGMASLSNASRCFPRIKRLYLRHNSIKDLILLDDFPQLELVDLTDNPMGIELAKFIAYNKNKFKSLKYKIRLTRDQFQYDEMDLLDASGLVGTVFEIVK